MCSDHAAICILEPSLAPDRPPLWVGCAAGFSGDRTDAAAPVVRALAASGQSACLIFETLAERTLALAQLARREQPDAGYEPLLEDLLEPVLADCLAHGIRIVSNFGAANPEGAARCIQRLAQRLGLRGRVAQVLQIDDGQGRGCRCGGGRVEGRCCQGAHAVLPGKGEGRGAQAARR